MLGKQHLECRIRDQLINLMGAQLKYLYASRAWGTNRENYRHMHVYRATMPLASLRYGGMALRAGV